MSTDEMIACLVSCRARSEIAALINALWPHPRLNTPVETKRLEAAKAAVSDPEKFEDYPLKEQERYVAKTTGITPQKMMDHKQMGSQLNRMAWVVGRLKSSYSLLTSDRPLVMTNGLGYSDSHFAMPIGPQRLLIAANDLNPARHLAQQPRRACNDDERRGHEASP